MKSCIINLLANPPTSSSPHITHWEQVLVTHLPVDTWNTAYSVSLKYSSCINHLEVIPKKSPTLVFNSHQDGSHVLFFFPFVLEGLRSSGYSFAYVVVLFMYIPIFNNSTNSDIGRYRSSSHTYTRIGSFRY